MARRDRNPRIWRGYRRPVLRDGVFWFAGLVAIAGIVVQSPLADWKGGTVDWIVLVVEVGLTIIGAYILVGVLAATIRGVGEGWRTAEVAAAASPKSSSPKSSSPDSATPGAAPKAPTGTASDRPPVGVALEKKARLVGRAVGAARRTYKHYE